jgi:hypothetical protein
VLPLAHDNSGAQTQEGGGEETNPRQKSCSKEKGSSEK